MLTELTVLTVLTVSCGGVDIGQCNVDISPRSDGFKISSQNRSTASNTRDAAGGRSPTRKFFPANSGKVMLVVVWLWWWCGEGQSFNSDHVQCALCAASALQYCYMAEILMSN